jgi:acid phosphatase family membrane protein YuiD
MPFIYIIVPLVAVFIAQVSKFLIPKNHLKPSIKNLLAYSGMPSSHAAVTISLMTIIGLTQGLASPLFSLATLVTFLALRDAMGIRQYIGKQGKVINELVEDLNEDRYLDDRYPQLIEKVGHTPTQIVVGALIGFFVAIVCFFNI